MVFAAKVLPPNPFDPIAYYVLKPGMVEGLSRMIAQCSTVNIQTGTRVRDISRARHGGFKLHCGHGRVLDVDDLVLASSGPPTARLLSGLPGTSPQLAALRGMEFHQARLALHSDPLYAPTDPNHRSCPNCHLQGGFCDASMWPASVVDGPTPATTAKLWKSWITHRGQLPKQILYETQFKHMLPTPATLAAQDRLGLLQGLDRLWFAGGYLYPYDSQETALRSALRVALGLQVTSSRSQMLQAALGGSAP